jgi:hypothetical protein
MALARLRVDRGIDVVMRRHWAIGLVVVGTALACMKPTAGDVPVVPVASRRPESPSQQADVSSPSFLEVTRTRLVRAEVARTLHEHPGEASFYVRVRLTNVSPGPIGIELGDPWAVIYPNQWGGSTTPERGVIDEEHLIVKPLTAAQQTELRRRFAAGSLPRIEPGGSLEYYRNFNASARQQLDTERTPYVIVALDGQVVATDGSVVEQTALDSSGTAAPAVATELSLTTPLQWAPIPADALVLTY